MPVASPPQSRRETRDMAATATSTLRSTHEPEDLLEIHDRPMPELVEGQLLERPMGEESDSIAAAILGLIFAFVRERGLGRVHGSQCGYQIFPDDPRKIRIPDVSFTRRERLPAGGPARGHARVAPDLVVEVVSPNDEYSVVEATLHDFLGAGVPLIWIVSPDTRTVQVHRGDGTSIRLRETDILDGGDVLPGFSCKISEFFV
jgi:Uma2 family endonuclease